MNPLGISWRAAVEARPSAYRRYLAAGGDPKAWKSLAPELKKGFKSRAARFGPVKMSCHAPMLGRPPRRPVRGRFCGDARRRGWGQ